jgi:RNA polymerase sigma-70 factor, ECF subfamily
MLCQRLCCCTDIFRLKKLKDHQVRRRSLWIIGQFSGHDVLRLKETAEMHTSSAAVTDFSTDLGDVLKRCSAGEKEALRFILDTEGGRLLGVANRMLQRRDLAEEAVQDTMVLIWRKAHQFRSGDGSARGWIYAILRNRCLNILRDGRRLETLSPDELTAMQDARLSAAGADIQLADEKAALRFCLEELDSRTRRSILLAHVGGFTHGEIAAIQSVPLGTCKSWIRRGLDLLRRCMA